MIVALNDINVFTYNQFYGLNIHNLCLYRLDDIFNSTLLSSSFIDKSVLDWIEGMTL